MRIGYIRVSSADQNIARQEVLMKELNVDILFIDKISGKNKERPELKKMMNFVRAGDVVVVESISRFARNTRDLLELVNELTIKGVEFESVKEKINTTTSAGQFMLTIFGAVAQLERDYILQRQREGIEIAKKQGKYKGRKKIVRDDFESVYKKWRKGEITAVFAMRKLRMSKTTFYRHVKEYEGALK